MTEQTLLNYDLVNPSDDITFRAASRAAAGLACMVLGHGAYGATCYADADWPTSTNSRSSTDATPWLLYGRSARGSGGSAACTKWL